MFRLTCLSSLLVSVATFATHAQITVSDTLDDGAFDSFFDYDTSSDFSGGNDLSEFIPGGFALYPDSVLITFPGATGPVIGVVVIGADFNGRTTVEFQGTMGSKSWGPFNTGNYGSVILPSDNIGDILSVRVTSNEGTILAVSATYIPTPAATAALALAGLVATRRPRA